MKPILLILALILLLNTSIACSFIQKITQCNAIAKGAFATAFAAAAAQPPKGCKIMTREQWKKVGCGLPRSLRFTKFCILPKWVPLPNLFQGTVLALKNKIVLKYNDLFYLF